MKTVLFLLIFCTHKLCPNLYPTTAVYVLGHKNKTHRKVDAAMKTAEEIIKYLETELADAQFMYDEMKGADKQRALAYLLKVYTITQILDDLKK